MHVVYLGTAGKSCSNSTECEKDDVKGFCNFDYGEYGFCELCSRFGEGECDTNGTFPQEKGKNECKKQCEGRFR